MDDDFTVVINGETYTLSDAKKKSYRKYWNARRRAKEQNIPFLFTFSEWLEWWKKHDFVNIGPKKYQLGMQRIDKSGPISPENVICGPSGALGGHFKSYKTDKKRLVKTAPSRNFYINARKVKTPDRIYNSISEAAYYNNLTFSGALNRARNKLFGWEFVENDPNIGP